jgi:hypothetical protein
MAALAAAWASSSTKRSWILSLEFDMSQTVGKSVCRSGGTCCSVKTRGQAVRPGQTVSPG